MHIMRRHMRLNCRAASGDYSLQTVGKSFDGSPKCRRFRGSRIYYSTCQLLSILWTVSALAAQAVPPVLLWAELQPGEYRIAQLDWWRSKCKPLPPEEEEMDRRFHQLVICSITPTRAHARAPFCIFVASILRSDNLLC